MRVIVPHESSHGARTQKARVLRALGHADTRGLDRMAFLSPDVIDGGTPILQFAGRIAELRADGHRVEVRGRTNRCARYVLITPPEPEPVLAVSVPAAAASADTAPLFDSRPATRSPLEPWESAR